MISSATFTPIALALVAVTLLTARVSHFMLHLEFQYAKWAQDFVLSDAGTFRRTWLPPLAALLREVVPFIWLLPLGTLIFAFRLRRAPEIPTVQVSWYVAFVVVALFAWFLLIVLAFWSVYSYYHYQHIH